MGAIENTAETSDTSALRNPSIKIHELLSPSVILQLTLCISNLNHSPDPTSLFTEVQFFCQ